jgi:hypothetical protein
VLKGPLLLASAPLLRGQHAHQRRLDAVRRVLRAGRRGARRRALGGGSCGAVLLLLPLLLLLLPPLLLVVPVLRRAAGTWRTSRRLLVAVLLRHGLLLRGLHLLQDLERVGGLA